MVTRSQKHATEALGDDSFLVAAYTTLNAWRASVAFTIHAAFQNSCRCVRLDRLRSFDVELESTLEEEPHYRGVDRWSRN